MRFFRVRLKMTAALALAVLNAAPALAYEPIHSKAKLNQPSSERVVRVRTAKVVLADYALIRRDFKATRLMSESAIDEWLLGRVAFISEPQAAQTLVNTAIQTGSEHAIAYRPAQYGRALVYQAGPGELIDGKGSGAPRAPSLADHADGLATLGEATREFLYEKLVRTVLAHSGSKRETVEHYAVVDWGFDVKHADGTQSPAGMVLRQAHPRNPTRASLFEDAVSRKVELTLRPYGLTSAGALRHKYSAELINIQGTPDGAILDFGSYLSVERFERPARHFYHMNNLIEPGFIEFVQPNPRIRVPFERWGYTELGIDDPKFDNPWVWSHRLADDFRKGAADRSAFARHFESLVGSYRRHLFFLGGEATPGIMESLVRGLREIH